MADEQPRGIGIRITVHLARIGWIAYRRQLHDKIAPHQR
jgi:hypothetical protein